MPDLESENHLIKDILSSAKTIAMVGVSSIKKEENSKNIRRRPSIIVMKYLQEFGFRVIPINPSSAGKKIHGETILSKLEEITVPIDIVNVFRPSAETPQIAKQAVGIKSKVLWLQYGIHSQEAHKIAKLANIFYIPDKCIKQEYQKTFLKVNPVFPVLQ